MTLNAGLACTFRLPKSPRAGPTSPALVRRRPVRRRTWTPSWQCPPLRRLLDRIRRCSPLDLPLIPFQFQNYNSTNSMKGDHDKKFCPDTPSVTFTQYALLRRMQAEVTIQGFQLPAPNEGQMKVIENP